MDSYLLARKLAEILLILFSTLLPRFLHGSPKWIATAPHIALSDTRALNLNCNDSEMCTATFHKIQ